jgi:hypothetical protein
MKDLFKILSGTRIVSDDTDIGLRVKYVGSEASATVTVASDGNLTFKHGDAGSEAVDDTVGASGVLDVSDTAYDTFGEVVDEINSSDNWEAYLVDVLRADSSNDTLLAMSEATISPNVEKDLVKDTSAALNLAIRIGGRKNSFGTEERYKSAVEEIISTNTYGSGTSKIQIYVVNETKLTETKIYEIAGGSTGTEQTLSFLTDGVAFPYMSQEIGQHLLIKMIGSAACTGSLQA